MREAQGGFESLDGIVEDLLHTRHREALVGKVFRVVVIVELKKKKTVTFWSLCEVSIIFKHINLKTIPYRIHTVRYRQMLMNFCPK